MTRVVVVCAAVVLCGTQLPVAQESNGFSAAALVSSWTLTGVERGVSGEKRERIPNPRGLLILDGVGNVYEFVTTASRQQPETVQADPLAMFAAYSGFWGNYRADTERRRITLPRRSYQ